MSQLSESREINFQYDIIYFRKSRLVRTDRITRNRNTWGNVCEIEEVPLMLSFAVQTSYDLLACEVEDFEKTKIWWSWGGAKYWTLSEVNPEYCTVYALQESTKVICKGSIYIPGVLLNVQFTFDGKVYQPVKRSVLWYMRVFKVFQVHNLGVQTCLEMYYTFMLTNLWKRAIWRKMIVSRCCMQSRKAMNCWNTLSLGSLSHLIQSLMCLQGRVLERRRGYAGHGQGNYGIWWGWCCMESWCLGLWKFLHFVW